MPLLSFIRSPLPWRLALALYGVALTVATHWPRLVIDGPVARPDLYIHVAAFGLLSFLLAMASAHGPAGSRRNAAFAWTTGVAWAAVDELTQAIPGLGRTAGWDDWGADVAGVTLGVLAAAGLARVLAIRTDGETAAS